MKPQAPKGWIYLLAVFLLGSSCRLGQALRQVSPSPSRGDPTVTNATAPGSDSERESILQPSQTPPQAAASTPTPTLPPEQPVTRIPLAGKASAAELEFSGLAWYGDTLVLLPQYPERLSERGQPGVLFTLKESSILAFLDGESQAPLEPAEVPFISFGIETLIQDFEGFESLAFIGDRAFLTIESGRIGPMMSYLVAGTVAPDFSEIQLDPSTLLNIPPQAELLNRGEEALVVAGDRLLSLFETNGAGIVPDPVAHRIDPETFSVDTLPFPNIEYRITGATPVDPEGRFWAVNTFFPGDFFIFPESDPIAAQFGQGYTHSRELAVERLLQMQVRPDGISLTGSPPVQLELLDSFQGRNWEGLAELPGRGFLLVTDLHPETILAFLPYP